MVCDVEEVWIFNEFYKGEIVIDYGNLFTLCIFSWSSVVWAIPCLLTG
jgi:hypothetical protein